MTAELRAAAREVLDAHARRDEACLRLHALVLADLVLAATSDEARADAVSDGGPDNDIALRVVTRDAREGGP